MVQGLYMTPQRQNQFKIMLSDEELRMVKELAEQIGVSGSDVVRQLIRREHAATIGESSRPKPKRK
jgi:DNA-binding MarR family transcriptional regulator